MDNKNYSSPATSKDGRSEAVNPGVWQDIHKWHCAACDVEYGSSRQSTYVFRWREEDGTVSDKGRLCGYCYRNHDNWVKLTKPAATAGRYLKYKNWLKKVNDARRRT